MIELGIKRQGKVQTAGGSDLGEEQYFPFIQIASVGIAIIMFIAYYCGRIGMGEVPNFLPLILSVSAILLPEVLRTVSRFNSAFLQTAVIMTFFLIGWISILLKIDLTIFVYAAFLISIFHQIRHARLSFGNRKTIKILLIVLFGLELTSSVWTPDYMNPLAPEAYAVGLRFIHVDTLFLSSITSNVRNFHFPTLGLFGLEPLKYHSGSNFLFAAYSQICRTDTLSFYNLAFPVIFIPQFFQGFIFAVFSNGKTKSIDRRIILSLVIFFFVLTGFISQRMGTSYMLPSSLNSHFISQSYCISLILTFLFISAYSPLVKRDKLDENSFWNAVLILLIPCWFFVIGYTKVSTGLVIFASIVYFIFRRKLIFNRWIAIAMALSALALYYVMEITVERNENTFIIQPGSFYKMFVKGNVIMYFLLNYSWLLLLIVGTLVIQRKSKAGFFNTVFSGKFIVVETIIVAAVVGALPGLLIHIEGGSSVYFSDIQYWLSAIALIQISSYFAFRYHNIKGRLLTYYKILSFVIAVVIVRESVFRSFYYFLKKNIRIRAALVYGKDNQRLQEASLIELAPIMNSLLFNLRDAEQFKSQTALLNLSMFDELRNLPGAIRSQSIIYCEDLQVLENFLPCSEATFYLTAMSEMAMINGLYWMDCWLAGRYGMRTYFSFPKEISKDQAFQLAREKGFRYVIILSLRDHKYVIKTL